MIDINKLRRLAQAATPGPWQIWHGWVASNVDSDGGTIIAERPTPSGGKYQARVDGNFRFIAAANPAAISELLDRLEAAEKERDELQAKIEAVHSLLDNDESKIIRNAKDGYPEGREPKELTLTERVAALCEYASDWQRWCNEAEAEIAAMKQQKPVGHVWRWDNGHIHGSSERFLPTGTKLYALPGAQNVPEKLCYDSRWEISIDYVDGWNAAVDMMRGKSPSWHCPDCCIAFPFGAPKSCPHDDARCNSLLAAASPEAKP